jgi:hypothetical protein
MTQEKYGDQKKEFKKELNVFTKKLSPHISTDDNQWTIKGFIDVFKNIYTISGDTKIVSKLLEIHLFPEILKFAEDIGYNIVLADHQNYYPDISFVNKQEPSLKFALDLKTTYRRQHYPGFCNSFTLGSHGKYFNDRTSKKNIQFPYGEYKGHFCLCAIYTRTTDEDIDETRIYDIESLTSITSVIVDIMFTSCEKWEIASDKSGSGNTANIGSIDYIKDILNCNGVFKNLGEEIFDDYWMNYGEITIKTDDGKSKRIRNIEDFVEYRGIDKNLINERKSKKGMRVKDEN